MHAGSRRASSELTVENILSTSLSLVMWLGNLNIRTGVKIYILYMGMKVGGTRQSLIKVNRSLVRGVCGAVRIGNGLVEGNILSIRH